VVTREAVERGVLDGRVVVDVELVHPDSMVGVTDRERAIRLARGVKAHEEEAQRLRRGIVRDELDERLAARERQHL